VISPGRATAILAAGTGGTLVAGVLVAKALAILTGPDGVGLYGLLVSLLGLASIVFGLGTGVGIVRAVARAIADNDAERATALGDAAALLAVAGGVLGGLVLAIFRGPIAGIFLGDLSRGTDVLIVAPAVLLQLAAAVELGVLNGYHRVRAMAVATGGTSLVGAAVIVALVSGWGVGALPVAVVLSSAVAYLITTIARRRSIPRAASVGRGRHHLRAAAGWLLGFGGTYTLSQLVGTGAQLLVPVIVLSSLGSDAVGYARAATAIAVGYLSVLLAAMARDYYPRAAAAPADQTSLRRLIDDQTRLVVVVAAPMILATSALTPLIITILYTDAFAQASGVLQWILVGDVLKLLSWTGSYVILARSGPTRFFAIELVGGASLVVTTVIGVGLFGVDGVGIGYALTYAIYTVVVWVAARPIVRIPITPAVIGGIGLAVGLAVFQSARSLLVPEVSAVLLLGSAGVALAIAWRTIRPQSGAHSR
jgi:antigen flippase